jgi:type IV secretion system protein VirD4
VALPVTFTQRIVWHLGYDSILGPPLFYQIPPWSAGLTVVLGLLISWMLFPYPLARVFLVPIGLLCIAFTYLAFLPFYPPLLGFHLFPNLLRGGSGTRGILLNSAFVTVVTVVLLVGTGIILNNLLRRKGQPSRIAHGSARYATYQDLKKGGLLRPGGVYLGAFRAHGRQYTLTDDSQHHTLFVMPSGAGKTAGHIIPSLLTRTHSAFVLDPKGELYDATAGWRAAQGHRCIRLAPLEDPALVDRWNPLDEIERGPQDVGAIRLMAEALIPGAGREDSHWDESARALFRCLALHTLYTEEQPTLHHVRALAHASGGMGSIFENVLEAIHDPELRRGWLDAETKEATPIHPEAALLARGFRDTPDREMGSIASTLRRALLLWGDSRVVASTAVSDFSLADFNDTKPMTVYCVIPYSDLHGLAPWVRILLALLVRRVTEGRNVEKALPLDLFLDEFASLGRVTAIHQILSFLRGYGVRAHLVIQSYDDLERLYGRGENISACQIHVAAATQSRGSRRFISDLGGEATVRWERHSSSGAKLQPIQPRENRSTAEARRPLITQGEVGTLGADEILIAKTGMPLIRATKRFYFKDRDLAARAAIQPPKKEPRPAANPRGASGAASQSSTPATTKVESGDAAPSRGGRERGERGR